MSVLPPDMPLGTSTWQACAPRTVCPNSWRSLPAHQWAQTCGAPGPPSGGSRWRTGAGGTRTCSSWVKQKSVAQLVGSTAFSTGVSHLPPPALPYTNGTRQSLPPSPAPQRPTPVDAVQHVLRDPLVGSAQAGLDAHRGLQTTRCNSEASTSLGTGIPTTAWKVLEIVCRHPPRPPHPCKDHNHTIHPTQNIKI